MVGSDHSGVEARFTWLRKELDKAGYLETFSTESLRLVEHLYNDLVKTTESLQKTLVDYGQYKQVAEELEDGVAPFKEENVRLYKENSQLRVGIAKALEKAEDKARDPLSRLHELETENNDLKLLVSQFAQRVKKVEIESLEKSKRIAQFQEKGLSSNISVTADRRKKVLPQQFKQSMEVEYFVPDTCHQCIRLRNYVQAGKGSDNNPQAIDYVKLADSRIEALQLQLRSLKNLEKTHMTLISSLTSRVDMRESEIEKLRELIKVRPGRDNLANLASSKDEKSQRNAIELKAAEMQLEILQRRNVELEEKLKTSILQEHEDFMHGKIVSRVDDRYISGMAKGFLEKELDKFPTHDKMSLLEKLYHLERQLSHCCKEKAVLQRLLDDCRAKHKQHNQGGSGDNYDLLNQFDPSNKLPKKISRVVINKKPEMMSFRSRPQKTDVGKKPVGPTSRQSVSSKLVSKTHGIASSKSKETVNKQEMRMRSQSPQEDHHDMVLSDEEADPDYVSEDDVLLEQETHTRTTTSHPSTNEHGKSSDRNKLLHKTRSGRVPSSMPNIAKGSKSVINGSGVANTSHSDRFVQGRTEAKTSKQGINLQKSEAEQYNSSQRNDRQNKSGIKRVDQDRFKVKTAASRLDDEQFGSTNGNGAIGKDLGSRSDVDLKSKALEEYDVEISNDDYNYDVSVESDSASSDEDNEEPISQLDSHHKFNQEYHTNLNENMQSRSKAGPGVNPKNMPSTTKNLGFSKDLTKPRKARPVDTSPVSTHVRRLGNPSSSDTITDRTHVKKVSANTRPSVPGTLQKRRSEMRTMSKPESMKEVQSISKSGGGDEEFTRTREKNNQLEEDDVYSLSDSEEDFIDGQNYENDFERRYDTPTRNIDSDSEESVKYANEEDDKVIQTNTQEKGHLFSDKKNSKFNPATSRSRSSEKAVSKHSKPSIEAAKETLRMKSVKLQQSKKDESMIAKTSLISKKDSKFKETEKTLMRKMRPEAELIQEDKRSQQRKGERSVQPDAKTSVFDGGRNMGPYRGAKLESSSISQEHDVDNRRSKMKSKSNNEDTSNRRHQVLDEDNNAYRSANPQDEYQYENQESFDEENEMDDFLDELPSVAKSKQHSSDKKSDRRKPAGNYASTGSSPVFSSHIGDGDSHYSRDKPDRPVGAKHSRESTIAHKFVQTTASEGDQDLNDRLNKLNLENSQHQMQALELREELDHTKRLLEAEKEDHEMAASELKRIRDHNNEMTSKLLRNSVLEPDGSLRRGTTQKDLEKEIISLRTALSNLNREKEDLKFEFNRKNDKLARLENDSSKKDNEISQFKAKLKHAELQVSHAEESANRQITLLERQLESHRRDLEETKKERDEAVNNLAKIPESRQTSGGGRMQSSFDFMDDSSFSRKMHTVGVGTDTADKRNLKDGLDYRSKMYSDHRTQNDQDPRSQLQTASIPSSSMKSLYDMDTRNMRGESPEKKALLDKVGVLQRKLEELHSECSRHQLKSFEFQGDLERTKHMLQVERRERELASTELKRLRDQNNESTARMLMNSALGSDGTFRRGATPMEMEREIINLRSALASLDKDKDEMRVELDRKDERLAQLAQEGSRSMDEVSHLKLRLKNSELQISHTGESAREQIREVEFLKKQLESNRRDLEKTIAERDDAFKDLHKLSGAQAKGQMERRGIESELEMKSKEADDLRKQVQRYIDEVRRIEELLLDKEEELEMIIQHYRSLTVENSNLEAQRTNLEREASSIRESVRDAVDQNIGIKTQLASQNALVQSLEEEIQLLTQQVSQLENQMETKMEKEKMVEADNKASKDLLYRIEVQMDKLKLDLADSESKRKQFEAENTELHAHILSLESRLQDETQRQLQLESVVANSREKDYQMEKTTLDVSRERDSLAEKLTNLQHRSETLNSEVSRYRLKSIELQNELDRTRRQLDSEKRDRETALSELKRVREQLNTTSANYLINTALGASGSSSSHVGGILSESTIRNTSSSGSTFLQNLQLSDLQQRNSREQSPSTVSYIPQAAELQLDPPVAASTSRDGVRPTERTKDSTLTEDEFEPWDSSK